MKLIILITVLTSIIKSQLSIEVFHNRALLTTNPNDLMTHTSDIPIDIELNQIKLTKKINRNRLIYTTTKQIRPDILKIYTQNITLNSGDTTILKCPYTNNNYNLNNENISFKNENIQLDENLRIKTVIWIKETTSPQILSNNEELMFNTNRFSLEPIFSESETNIDYAIKYKKIFNLKICPLKSIDTGWYSCYVVKRFSNEQNVKYYTYLNVIKQDSYDDEETSENESSNEDYYQENLKCKSYLENDETKSKQVFTSTVNIKTSEILNLNDDIKNITLKRQIDSPDSLNNQSRTNRHEFEKIFHVNFTTNLIENENLNNKESLTVSPKFLNISKFKSFQLDCVYKGVDFLELNLVWLKNDRVLNVRNQKRYLVVNYKQNNTSVSILKFSYALLNDTGLYKCLVLSPSIDNKRNLAPSLEDTSMLIVNKYLSKDDDNNFKYSSYLEERKLNRANLINTQMNIEMIFLFYFFRLVLFSCLF